MEPFPDSIFQDHRPKKTFISKPQDDVQKDKEHLAKERLLQLCGAINDNSVTNLSSSKILQKVYLSQEEFEECLKMYQRETQLYFKAKLVKCSQINKTNIF